MADTLHREFDLHVWKKRSTDGEEDLYTIGVWDGNQIKSLCHIAPIEIALAILRNALETAGKPASARQL